MADNSTRKTEHKDKVAPATNGSSNKKSKEVKANVSAEEEEDEEEISSSIQAANALKETLCKLTVDLIAVARRADNLESKQPTLDLQKILQGITSGAKMDTLFTENMTHEQKMT